MEINTKPLQSIDPAVKVPDGDGIPQKPPVQPQEPQFDPFKKDIVKQTQEEEKDPKKASEKLSDAVDKLNKTAVVFDRSLRFSIHEQTRMTMVDVVDTTTDKVIREIPSKEVLDFVAKMKDYMGMIFDKKA